MFVCGKGRHTYMYMYASVWKHYDYYSITVQRNRMKFTVHRGPSNVNLGLSLWHCSSFGFGIENVLVSRSDPPFKCAVDKKL